jgi:hypothetical protein
MNVRFEDLIAVVMNNTIFWNITPCSPLKVNRRFGRTYHLHLQGWISRVRYQRESRWQARRWRTYIPPKSQLTFNGLRGVISQKILIFRTTDDVQEFNNCIIFGPDIGTSSVDWAQLSRLLTWERRQSSVFETLFSIKETWQCKSKEKIKSLCLTN